MLTPDRLGVLDGDDRNKRETAAPPPLSAEYFAGDEVLDVPPGALLLVGDLPEKPEKPEKPKPVSLGLEGILPDLAYGLLPSDKVAAIEEKIRKWNKLSIGERRAVIRELREVAIARRLEVARVEGELIRQFSQNPEMRQEEVMEKVEEALRKRDPNFSLSEDQKSNIQGVLQAFQAARRQIEQKGIRQDQFQSGQGRREFLRAMFGVDVPDDVKDETIQIEIKGYYIDIMVPNKYVVAAYQFRTKSKASVVGFANQTAEGIPFMISSNDEEAARRITIHEWQHIANKLVFNTLLGRMPQAEIDSFEGQLREEQPSSPERDARVTGFFCAAMERNLRRAMDEFFAFIAGLAGEAAFEDTKDPWKFLTAYRDMFLGQNRLDVYDYARPWREWAEQYEGGAYRERAQTILEDRYSAILDGAVHGFEELFFALKEQRYDVGRIQLARFFEGSLLISWPRRTKEIEAMAKNHPEMFDEAFRGHAEIGI